MTDFDAGDTNVVVRAGALELLAVDLAVIDGPDRGLRKRVGHGQFRIGTAEGCDLRITDPTVSRHHCAIDVGRDAARIVDAGSTNGTFVDGVRVRDAEIAPGSVVRIGSTSMRVEVGDEPSYVSLSANDSFGELIGASVEMRRAYAVLERAAATDTTVLVRGETGTGKELAARAIHERSSRSSGPFVAIDCGAIAETLIESELFGHARGAFSGAISDRRGVFEDAHGGTLFFDEIGELPTALQPKLLRVLETREVRRVGGNSSRRVDVRVVAATNRPLEAAINDRTFREDLYYRLAVLEVNLPPLRLRRDDIPALADRFFARFGGTGSAPTELIARLGNRPWPGNVRELRNYVERFVSMGMPMMAPLPESLPMDDGISVPIHLPLKEARERWIGQFEAVYLRALLARTKGNVTRAAEIAGVNRRLLQRMAARIGGVTLDDDDLKD